MQSTIQVPKSSDKPQKCLKSEMAYKTTPTVLKLLDLYSVELVIGTTVASEIWETYFLLGLFSGGGILLNF